MYEKVNYSCHTNVKYYPYNWPDPPPTLFPHWMAFFLMPYVLAAVMEYHTGWLINNRNLFLTVLDNRKVQDLGGGRFGVW